MTGRAMKRFNIPQKALDKTRLAVGRSMYNLEKKDKTVKSFKAEDGRSKVYGLAEWFDGKGELKKAFKSQEK